MHLMNIVHQFMCKVTSSLIVLNTGICKIFQYRYKLPGSLVQSYDCMIIMLNKYPYCKVVDGTIMSNLKFQQTYEVVLTLGITSIHNLNGIGK